MKKGNQHLLHERQEIFTFMKLHQRRFPVGKMSQVFGVNESGYYRFYNAEPSARTVEKHKFTTINKKHI